MIETGGSMTSEDEMKQVQADRSELLRRIRRRRMRRGAVMVEGLVVIPFFIMIFGASMFMGKLYENTLNAQFESREAAWKDARTSCGPNSNAYLPPASQLDLVAAEGAPGTKLCNANFGAKTSTVSDTNSVSGAATDYSQTTTVTTTVMCNEDSQAGDFEGAVAWLWHALSGTGENPLAEGDPTSGGTTTAPPIVYTFDDIYLEAYGLQPY